MSDLDPSPAAPVVIAICHRLPAPRDSHWTLLKLILRYIRGTMSLGLTLTASAGDDLAGDAVAAARVLLCLAPTRSAPPPRPDPAR